MVELFPHREHGQSDLEEVLPAGYRLQRVFSEAVTGGDRAELVVCCARVLAESMRHDTDEEHRVHGSDLTVGLLDFLDRVTGVPGAGMAVAELSREWCRWLTYSRELWEFDQDTHTALRRAMADYEALRGGDDDQAG